MYSILIININVQAHCGTSFCSCNTGIHYIHVNKGRFKSCLVDSETYLLTCYRYIELNPVRAKMVNNPEEYLWSSYSINAGIRSSDLLTHHEVYLSLGNTNEQRTANYQNLFLDDLSYLQLDSIRLATNRGLVVGSDAFKDAIERIIGQSVRPSPVGRPSEVREEQLTYIFV